MTDSNKDKDHNPSQQSLKGDASPMPTDKAQGKTIVLSAGGTGGHFFPAKSLAADCQFELPQN